MSRLPRSFVIFILFIAFGSLFMGCSSKQAANPADEFTFTEQDLQRMQQTVSSTSTGAEQTATGTSSTVTVLGADSSASPASSTASSAIGSTAQINLLAGSSSVSSYSSSAIAVILDPAKQKQYDSLRVAVADDGANVYRVNNAFLNVRSSMTTGAAQVEKLTQGDTVTVLDIPSAQWAKIKMADGKEGYAAFRYLAKITTEDRLAVEKKQFEGQYFVDFPFLNIRKDPSAQAEKIAELPGQAIVKPLSINGEWAHIAYQGKDGYVSSKYLSPFLPAFLVRQDSYTLPLLEYRAGDSGSMASLPKHIAALKAAGKKIVTLKSLYTTVLDQEKRDTRILPNTVVLTIAGVTAKNVKEVSDALQAAHVSATLFVQTKEIGLSGITEKTILTLMANGNEIQSEGHTGDDLRSLTDAQLTLELGQSKKIIQDITHQEVYAISYPQGGVNDRVMKMAAATGYLFGIGQAPDTTFTRSQFLRLPSLYVGSSMTPEEVTGLTK